MVQVRNEDLLWARVGDEVVLLDRRRDAYLRVNPSGAVLWPSLVDGCRPSELVARLVDTYGIDAHQAAADVDALLAGLDDEDLLVADPDDAFPSSESS